jgi:uncharacterized membrane protein YdcZ (DUF606 family)
MFFCLLVVGQLTMSAIMEHFGILGMPKHAVTWTKAFIILLGAGGTAVASMQTFESGHLDAGFLLVLCTVSTAGGAAMPLQAAVNNKVSTILPNKLQAALVSFTVGVLVLLPVAFVVYVLSSLKLDDLVEGFEQTEWWMYFGAWWWWS